MSRRENKELAKTNLKNMDKTMQELQHNGSIKDLRPKNSLSTNINHKGLQRTANEYAEGRRIYKDLISKNNDVDVLNSARAKQLSMATIPLCSEFFRGRVDDLQS